MSGELVPLVLLPRYTTYAGVPDDDIKFFSTIAMDVTQYSKAIVNFWRGKIVGTPAVFKIWFKESTDQVSWTVCDGCTGTGEVVNENLETQYTLTIKKRWFRIEVLLGDPDNVATCWAVGFLEERLR